MLWHDKPDDGRLEGVVIVWVVWREKGESLGWWAPHESWRAIGYEGLLQETDRQDDSDVEHRR